MLRIQEKILLHQARRGNQAAFARLCSAYREKIYQFIYFKTSHQEKAQDLTSEVFFKILDYLANGGEIKNFRSFVYQTARNLIVDFYRQKEQREISLEEIDEEIEEPKDLAQEIDLKLNLYQIEEALKKIPDRYREVLILRYVDDLSFKEIAQILNQNQTNVRQLASRGLKLLRKRLITDD
ncbi:MAG: RNA polymerase sigma factor [Patescibacteria group bacterium]|nr:RNA polymerase sigma factor [Patescibacteria group bacterium]